MRDVTELFRDVEDYFATYLREQLLAQYGDQLPVGSRLPSPRPSESVVLIRTGGVITTERSESPQLTIDARAGTERRAYQVISRVRSLMHDAAVLLDPVYAVTEVGGPQNYPDPTTPDQARYTMTVIVHLSA